MSPLSVLHGRKPGDRLAASAPSRVWLLLVTPPASGAANMALDEALMARSRADGEVHVRVYGWSEPTLSFGRHQSARGRYDLRRAAELGVRFVRRPTGGRAVLHHREITYCVAAPVGALGSLRESYGRINRLLVDALRRLGVVAEEAGAAGPAPRPGVAPCFEEPVAGEIVAAGRKLVGSAQWRDRGALLQHGSILVDDDQALAGELLLSPPLAAPSPATLTSLLGRAPSAGDFAAALGEAVACIERQRAAPMELDLSLASAAHALTAQYESDAWTWRR